MVIENQYVAAELDPNIVNDIKSFEETLRERTHKKVIVIAYEKEDKNLERLTIAGNGNCL